MSHHRHHFPTRTALGTFVAVWAIVAASLTGALP